MNTSEGLRDSIQSILISNRTLGVAVGLILAAAAIGFAGVSGQRLAAYAGEEIEDQGKLAVSIFQQGAGLIDAYTAAHSTARGCANCGLDIGADLAGMAHYGGRALGAAGITLNTVIGIGVRIVSLAQSGTEKG